MTSATQEGPVNDLICVNCGRPIDGHPEYCGDDPSLFTTEEA